MDLHVEDRDTTFWVMTQGFSLELPDTPSNRKVTVVFLRALKDQNGKPLFTLEQLAAIVGSTHRQAASQHVEEFRACGEDIKALVLRKRKVDAEVVEAVAHELAYDPLASPSELASRVNERLGRDDLTPANIEAGLEQIPATLLRKLVQHQLVKGTLQYQEEALLEMAFTALQSASPPDQARAVTVFERAAIEATGEEEMKRGSLPEEALKALCTPHTPLIAIPWSLQLMVVCLTWSGYGVPLRVLGRWMGVHKTTVFRWIVRLAEGLWGLISAWIRQSVKGGRVYLDEKWVKIQGRWAYWFVALDGETGLPIVHELMSRHRKWNCLWIVVKLKRLGLRIRVVVTDGLKGYRWAIPQVFPQATHQLCLCHHQQHVSKFAKEHFLPEERQERKTAMKNVFQTNDKRPVKNRLAQ